MTIIKRNINFKEIFVLLLFILFIFSSLFFPFGYRQNNSVYYITFFLPNLFLVALFFFCIFTDFSSSSVKKEQSTTGFKFILSIFFVLSFYYAFRYQNWYWDLINKGISFLLFFLLCEKIPHEFFFQYRIISITAIALAIMAFSSVFLYYGGIEGIRLENDLSYTIVYHGQYPDTRQEWLFFHKSIYAVLLLLALSLTLRARRLLFSPILWVVCLIGISWALICTSTTTSIFGMALIYAGYLISLIPIRQIYKKHPREFLIFGALTAVCLIALLIFLFFKLTSDRDLSTLGDRLPIWEASIEMIKQHPYGVGLDFEKIYLYSQTNNCHNVFLNEIFRFSIPAGITYLLLFIYLFIKSGFKQGLFSLSIWAALFMAWGMDYSMRVETLSIVIFLIYFTLFFPLKSNRKKLPKHE